MMPDYHRQGLWKEWLSVISKEVTINNQVGLHARPATFFIQKANEFKSSIWIERDERRVNAKSLLGVLSLGIVKGTTVNIVADGVDENEAIACLLYTSSFERELMYLTVHSTLHLIGYDHVDEAEMKRQMRAREELIMSGLGV